MNLSPYMHEKSKVGGRFWALADEEDEADEDELPPAASPSPSDLVCESIQLGYSEEQMANCIDGLVPATDCAWNGLGGNDEDRVEVLRRVIHRQTSANAIRPWKGPLPKVRLPALTLADFIDNWKKVSSRRKTNRSAARKQPPVTTPAVQEREARLELLLRHVGPCSSDGGLMTAGYKAQLATLQHHVGLQETKTESRSYSSVDSTYIHNAQDPTRIVFPSDPIAA